MFSLHLAQGWRGSISDAPVFLRFAAVFTLAGGHLARDDGREKCRVNDADGTVLQGGEFQRGANANGDYIHGSNEARAHDEGGPFKVFIQDQVSLNGHMLILISTLQIMKKPTSLCTISTQINAVLLYLWKPFHH